MCSVKAHFYWFPLGLGGGALVQQQKYSIQHVVLQTLMVNLLVDNVHCVHVYNLMWYIPVASWIAI